MDELIHSHSADHMFSGLSSNVAKSTELLGGKAERKIIVRREMETIALRLRPNEEDTVAGKFLNLAKALTWDEWQALAVKNELARLLNPGLLSEFKDDHALDDEAWRDDID